MALEQEVMAQLKAAMLSKNEAGLRALRAIKSAILLAKTSEGKKDDLTADDEIKLLQKLAKQRKDSLEMFETQGREDLAVKEREELAIIETFLPKALSPEELKAALQQIMSEVGATGPGDLGKVMGVASKALAGKADGKAISAMVKELLA
ncbi:MAG: GatB/YqeY domain-containing protein [Chitinophagaceae bacterium]|nr:GatB/YqeY domain-containing protein [Chitinophagaceae bacterium]